MAPPADAGEEMALVIAFEVVGVDIHDAPFVNVAWRDMAGGDKVAQPLRGVRIELVVVGGHNQSPTIQSALSAHFRERSRQRFAMRNRFKSGNPFIQRSQTGTEFVLLTAGFLL